MQILPIRTYNLNNFYPYSKIFNKNNRQNCIIKQNNSDVFVKNISFTACTSAGNPLRRLKNITCPYMGVEMLSGKTIKMIEKALSHCENIKDVIKVLSPYKANMQKIEKKMYMAFKVYAKKYPKATLPECLMTMYDGALTKLKLEEFDILDNVDRISLQMSPHNALEVHKKTTQCRQVIIDNNPEHPFKRKTLLSSLEEITPNNNELLIYEKLMDTAEYLPTSGTSVNAFVVKYANRSQEEIAARILRPSMASIEHIKPHSLQGKNIISNFMLASSGANSRRSSLPLKKFIKMYPNIPINCQKYVNQIINLIHDGYLQGYETYPYNLKQTLYRESDGKIVIDLSKYKYSELEAIEKVKNSLSYKKNNKN